MRVRNIPQMKQRRQYLRNNSTTAERLLWRKLRKSQLGGLKFRRQQGFGPYIVDFYCSKAKLAVEIDGDTHAEPKQKSRDERKREYINTLGIKLIRFTNQDVVESMEGVLQNILSNHPLTPSLSKEGKV